MVQQQALTLWSMTSWSSVSKRLTHKYSLFRVGLLSSGTEPPEQYSQQNAWWLRPPDFVLRDLQLFNRLEFPERFQHFVHQIRSRVFFDE